MYEPSTSCGEVGLILHDIFNCVFGYKNDGIFIEVGANDGKTGSFTYNLGKIGWKGINCEPVPRLYTLCSENTKTFKNVINIQTAVGEKESKMDIIDAGTLSTMDVNTLNLYLNTEWSKPHFRRPVKHKVTVQTLDNILASNLTDIESKNIDLFVLDVEGFEEKVLNGFSIERYSPKMIIIEIADQHESFINNVTLMLKFKKLREYFKLHNYELLVNDIVDNVYVNKKWRNDNNDLIRLFQNKIRAPQYKIVGQKHFITFGAGENKFIDAGTRLVNQAKTTNLFDNTTLFNKDFLKADKIFWDKHSQFLLNNKRGFGYWIWKSYIINKTFQSADDGDIIMYLDAGCEIGGIKQNNISTFFNHVKNDKIIYSPTLAEGWKESNWNKMDTFKFLNLDNNDIYNAEHVEAVALIFYVCDETRHFVDLWYNICSNNYNLIDDSPSKEKNLPQFYENRHDQSIFSLLLKKLNFKSDKDIKNCVYTTRNISGKSVIF